MKKSLFGSVAALALLATGAAFAQNPGAALPTTPSSREAEAPTPKAARPEGMAQDRPAASSPKAVGVDEDKAGKSKMGETAAPQNPKAADAPNGSRTTSTSDTKSGTTETKTTGNAATSATAAPPAEKRTQISTAIRSEKVEEVKNVNFNISVGTTIPSTVRFHALPPRIVEIYPEWRGYDFILVNGRYIIVRPETHEIVYIIEG